MHNDPSHMTGLGDPPVASIRYEALVDSLRPDPDERVVHFKT